MNREHITRCLEPISNMVAWPKRRRDDGLTNAAVLMPLIEREQWHILLTTRTEHLRRHAGQVSFPGGRADEQDKTPRQTALRETYEEVGIKPEFIEVAGIIEPYLTVTDFHVVPIVGFVQPDVSLTIDKGEVAGVFEVPMLDICDRSNYQRKKIHWQGEWREYWEFMHQEHRIWGATAAMLYSFAGRLSNIKSLL